ncbi:MAG: 5'-deoxynucleotidase [Ruminococcus sp.]|nr:5'-deoxynucleotidase [Ruminococcus sp.]
MSSFFAILSRMKYINRWGLMNNTKYENISEHSLQVAMFSHILVTVANKRLGESLDAEKAAVIGIYHDASEIITGDMPTPIKYYNADIKSAYKEIEHIAEQRLLSLLPEDIREEYEDIVSPTDQELLVYVKAADKLSALIKCIEEVRMGNMEFNDAKKATEKTLHAMNLPALEIFMEEFLPSFYKTLDEL